MESLLKIDILCFWVSVIFGILELQNSLSVGTWGQYWGTLSCTNIKDSRGFQGFYVYHVFFVIGDNCLALGFWNPSNTWISGFSVKGKVGTQFGHRLILKYQGFQKIPKDSKRFRRIPKGSMCTMFSFL